MDLLELGTALLSIVGVFLAVWICLPDLLLLLGLTGVRQGIEAGPEGAAPSPANPVSEELDAQLTALGFVPAGVYWEALPAHKIFREYVFASHTADCFATVHQIFDNDPPRVSFFTAFANQAFVNTQNYQGGLTADEPTLRAGGLPLPAESRPLEQERCAGESMPRRNWLWLGLIWLGGSALCGTLLYASGDTSWRPGFLFAFALLALVLFRKGRYAPQPEPSQETPPLDQRDPLPEVLAEHRRRLAHFRSLGHTPSPGQTVDDFLEAQKGFYNHPTLWRELRSSSLIFLPLKIGFLAVGPVILAYSLGIGHPLVWIALLAPSLVVFYFRKYGFPVLAAMDRATQGGH